MKGNEAIKVPPKLSNTWKKEERGGEGVREMDAPAVLIVIVQRELMDINEP